jgi:hypothetical protein
MPNGNAIRSWTTGAISGLVVGALIGGILAAATASSPASTASAPSPCAPAAKAATAAASAPPAPSSAVMAAPDGTARWTARSTQYASGDHLWFSWRGSMVRWLGGQPVPTAKEQRAAAREGWWGETVNTPPSALAFVTTDR